MQDSSNFKIAPRVSIEYLTSMSKVSQKELEARSETAALEARLVVAKYQQLTGFISPHWLWDMVDIYPKQVYSSRNRDSLITYASYDPFWSSCSHNQIPTTPTISDIQSARKIKKEASKAK